MYSIFSTYAKRTVTYRPAKRRRNADGDVFEEDGGYRMRFTELGNMIDPDTGDVVKGIRRPGLAASQRARRGRALGKLELEDVAKDMRSNGFEDMTEAKLADWWMAKHRGSKGIEWNLYYSATGQLVPDEEIGLEQQDAQAAVEARGGADDGDIMKPIEGTSNYICEACADENSFLPHPQKGIVPSKGLAGHRRSNVHVANVKAFRMKQQSEPQGAGV